LLTDVYLLSSFSFNKRYIHIHTHVLTLVNYIQMNYTHIVKCNHLMNVKGDNLNRIKILFNLIYIYIYIYIYIFIINCYLLKKIKENIMCTFLFGKLV